MIEIEFEPPRRSLHDCCGNTTISLTRFVYRDGDAHAVYLAAFTAGHERKVVSGLISLGEWTEEATPDDRVAFPFQPWPDDANFNVSLMDAAQSPWQDTTFFGRILDRAEALAHPWREEAFHITDHMAIEDKEIADYLRG